MKGTILIIALALIWFGGLQFFFGHIGAAVALAGPLVVVVVVIVILLLTDSFDDWKS